MQIRDSGQVSDNLKFQEVMDDSNSSMTSSYQAQNNETHINDLAERIHGLYRLLDLCKDDGSNGLVDKIIISKESLKKLCNDMVPSSFKSISEINYTKLNSISFRLIGCYGNHVLIAKFLLNRNIINQQLYNLLIASQSSVSMNNANKPSLRPGIYLLIVNSGLGLVIHWPEFGCYEENASSQRKKNMVNLHRYLTRLTDHQVCFMSDTDLESFDWNLEDADINLVEEDETHYEFEVTKNQKEQEDFKMYPGFKVDLSNKIRTEINQKGDYISLYPIVVESTTNQSFVTRQLIKQASKFEGDFKYFCQTEFQNYLKNILQDHYLHFNRNKMDMMALELFVKYGLEMEDELLDPLHKALDAAKTQNESRRDQEKSAIHKDIDIIKQIISVKLYGAYSHFDKSIAQDDQINMNIDHKRIQTRYPGIENKIDDAIKINSEKWKKMKTRYNLTCIIIEGIFEKKNEVDEKEDNDEATKSATETFYDMFIDDETDLHKLIEKYTQQSQQPKSKNFISRFGDWNFRNSKINKAERVTKDESDVGFIKKLKNYKLFEGHDDIKEKIISAFLKEYQRWKREIFPNNQHNTLPKVSFNKRLEDKLRKEYEEEKQKIEKNEFERICNEIEHKYQNGSMQLNLLNVQRLYSGLMMFTYEVEKAQPDQLQITIYETSLKEEDSFLIQENESHVPCPILQSHFYSGQYGTSFNIDSLVYEFSKISQFDNKFLLILWNKKTRQVEIFFDTSQRLAQKFKTTYSINPFKKLNTNENFLVAINEPKELIAIYDKTEVVLNVFSFNDDRSHLYGRNVNIQLLQWYNNSVPSIKYFLFVKNTEELCFVEKSGRARIFNLINLQFRPAVCDLPSNTANVLSSPDGSCIVAFVKEKIEVDKLTNDDERNENTSIDNEKKHDSTNDVKKINRAYVYFYTTNFGSLASKVIDLPLSFKSLKFLQFSCVNKRQTHLMSLDLQKGCFNSSIIKITLEKTQYRFQKCIQKQFVKFNNDPNTNYILIEGKNTHFEKNIQIGENIVIMGEKYSVIEVLSDTKIKIACDLKPISSGSDDWMDFHIEPKAKLNGLINTYKLMFEKYPIDSCIDPEQNRPLSLKIVLDIKDDEKEKYSEKFEDYISEAFENIKRSTNKPAANLKKFSTSVATLQEFDIENTVFQKKFSSKYELGEWIIQLCCLIPMQIAVTRNNLFQPLKDGLSSNENDLIELENYYGHHVDSVAKNISFGWYEGIFKHFGDKKVKVVSSMGEQSCGKSFMLNHLVGTTFDGSAMRCTDGVWMSLVNTKEYIYVALDFEGLKSLERTPQEDMFLTLFNTVISNLVLFKNQFTINRDMSTMFQRFQDGARLFESDPKIFQAKLCIIIKDVPMTEKDEITREFRLRFDQIVAEEGGDNFITRMYRSGLNIIPWPVFNDKAWFKMLEVIKKMLDKQEAKYENARTFIQNTKVIMAKLKICDWGSLDENLIQICVSTLKRLLPTVVSYGLEQKDVITEQLMNHDTREPIDDPMISLSEILHNFEKSTKLLPDTDIWLYDEHETFVRLSEDLRGYFEENIQVRKESSDDEKWFTNFDRFIKCIIERRISRIREWYSQNTAKFPQDNSDIINGKYGLEQEISKLIILWTLCGLTCHQCGLKCVKNRDHKEDHDCLTDHKCHFPCHFIEAHNNRLIPVCSHKAGHEGKHACDKISHLCGKPCNLIDKRNCQEVCSKEIGHDDGEHLCQSKRHYCGKDCSLSTHTKKGDYRCPNQCIISYEEEHDSHRCENETCPIQCPISDCQRRCQSNDHFHSYSDSNDHFCGKEHPCQEDCEDEGICKVVTEPKKREETYKGLLGTSITFTKYIQISERSRCNKKIPPNEFNHTGKHTHEENEENRFHYCDAKCQFCEYFCTLPHGHTQVHDTRHGNMTQTEFTGEDYEFEYKGHKLRVGDQGTFVLCNLHCKELGRHRHIDYCKSEENCKLGNQGQDIQHINEKVHPNPEKSKDFISHKLFWERTGFRDPYSVQEQQDFTKCDHECSDEKHHKSQGSTSTPPTKSFCERPLFHVSLDPSSNPPDGYGYISFDGHHFKCENPNIAFHIIFVLDRSGSMKGRDKRPIPNFPIYNDLIKKHNNRNGAVYQAVYQFMEARINSAKANQNQVPSAIRDSISLILFNKQVIVPFENRDLKDSKDLLNIMLQHQACGGTNYDLAIQQAGLLITNYFDPTRINIIVFLSDGECSIPTNQLNKICKQNETRGHPLYLYTVLFGSDSDNRSLEEMANIAQSYHPANTSSGALRCQFARTVNEVSLVNHFTSVAESLRKHKPALLKKEF